MLKRLILISFVLLLASANAFAELSQRVAVAPFNVYSQEDLKYLSQGIQDMLGSQLLQRGLNVASQADTAEAFKKLGVEVIDERVARDLGQALKVDFVIYGSLTKIGRRISLDARIVDPAGLKKTTAVFVQDEGLENLAASVSKLASEATVRVSGRQKIEKIEISGNERIEADAIRRILKSKEGEAFSEGTISDDLKRIYGMTFFDDVKVDVTESPEGKIVKFIVEEKPSIQRIEFFGNRMIEATELRDVLGYKLYAILDPRKLVESVDKLKDFYREKGYYKAKIEYELKDITPKAVSVVYQIDEGNRLYIRKIEFLGNEAFSDSKLRSEMETSEKGWLSFLTDSGILKKDELKKDLTTLTDFYMNRGFIRVKVGEPQVEVDGEGLSVTISIEEGPRFKVGKVTLSGDVMEKEALDETVKLTREEYFNREAVRKDVRDLSTFYANRGYAFAHVSPLMDEHEDTLTMDVDYQIDKKGLVYFERISISGNTKTRDKVIRRELWITEGELFSAEGLKRSNINLQKLGYFSEINLKNTKGSADDKMNVDIEVKERPTGALAVGAGYSSFNKLFGTVRISQNNLDGKGQKLSLETIIGSRATDYSLNFVEPWLFDIPLAFSTRLYNRIVDYEDYDKNAQGFSLGLSYPIYQYVTLSGRYLLEDIEISNIIWNAPEEILALAGDSSTRSVSGQIRRDTTNRAFNPTEGSDISLTVDYAGGSLGGTNYFTRAVADSGLFIPLPWGDEHTFFIRGRLGWLTRNEGGYLPAYEKLTLGGINSLRGYRWSNVGPRDPATGARLGGERMALVNLEYIFPLLKEEGVVGVVFYDQGNAWTEEHGWDLGDLRKSFGAGMRYYSPLGPLRLEWARILDPDQWDEEEETWEFTIGTFF